MNVIFIRREREGGRSQLHGRALHAGNDLGIVVGNCGAIAANSVLTGLTGFETVMTCSVSAESAPAGERPITEQTGDATVPLLLLLPVSLLRPCDDREYRDSVVIGRVSSTTEQLAQGFLEHGFHGVRLEGDVCLLLPFMRFLFLPGAGTFHFRFSVRRAVVIMKIKSINYENVFPRQRFEARCDERITSNKTITLLDSRAVPRDESSP